jgi:hypothetical protein
MAAVRCGRCRAIVSAWMEGECIEIGYGASYRTKCKALPEPAGTDVVSSASECPHMDKAMQRAAFRIRREAAKPKVGCSEDYRLTAPSSAEF